MADQRVPDELLQIAMQNPYFKRSRQKSGGRGRHSGGGGGGSGGGGGGGAKGRGYGGGAGGRAKLRPGLGATTEVSKFIGSFVLSAQE